MLQGNQGDTPFSLSTADKMVVESFLQEATQSPDVDNFADRFTDSQHPAWVRYVNGIYNHPKTWWIGIIQIQMVSGI